MKFSLFFIVALLVAVVSADGRRLEAAGPTDISAASGLPRSLG